jgi:hypothetical protein
MRGNNTATGTFTHIEGILLFSNKWSGNFTKNANGNLQVLGNVNIGGSLTLGGGDITMNLTGTSPSKINVTGSVAASGTNTLNITTEAVTNYVLIEAASGITSTTPYALNISGITGTLSVNNPVQLLLTATAANPQVTAVVISPNPASVQTGQTQQFTAAVTAIDGADPSVTWSISEQNSMLTNISTSGLLTAGSNETSTSLKVKAVSDFNNAIFDEVTVTIGTTGITDITNSRLRIYPNPTKGELIIENGELQIEKVEILDITGRTVLTSHGTTINISHLSAGTYFVKLRTDKGELTKKVIKE